MSNALTGAVAAIYVSDPAATPTTFTQISLVDQGDHKSWAAAYGYRYWKQGETFLIEKQVHGIGSWIDITSLCTFDYLRGMITLEAALNADDLVRASGKRIVAVKLSEEIGFSLKADKDEIEATNRDSGLGKEFIMGFKSWSVTAKKHHIDESAWKMYDNTTAPLMIVCFSEDGTSKKNFAGFGFLKGYAADKPLKDVQAEDLTFRGNGKFVWETNA